MVAFEFIEEAFGLGGGEAGEVLGDDDRAMVALADHVAQACFLGRAAEVLGLGLLAVQFGRQGIVARQALESLGDEGQVGAASHRRQPPPFARPPTLDG